MTLLLGLAGVSAIMEWIAVAARRRKWEYVTKPAALAFLIAWFLMLLPRPWPAQGGAVALALLLSLIGDVLLILPGNRFIQGLSAFLLAHIAYIVAFNWDGPVMTANSASLALMLAVVAFLLLRQLRAALREKGHERLVPAVAVYAMVLAIMLWSTLTIAQRPAWHGIPAALVSAGGALFYLSDVGIAWNLFVRRLPGDRLLTMVAYHLAQFALAYGAGLRLTGG